MGSVTIIPNLRATDTISEQVWSLDMKWECSEVSVPLEIFVKLLQRGAAGGEGVVRIEGNYD